MSDTQKDIHHAQFFGLSYNFGLHIAKFSHRWKLTKFINKSVSILGLS